MNNPASARPAEIDRYFGHDTPLAELVAIGRSSQSVARPGLPPHAHDVLEICVIERGQVDWFVGSQTYPLAAGAIFFTKPQQTHGSMTEAIQPCVLSWLQVDQRLVDRALSRELLAIERSTWLDDGRLAGLHGAMLDECRHPRPDSPRMTRALLLQFLSTAIRQAGPTALRQELPTPVQRVIDLIEERPDERWTLDQLQRHAGVGRSRLHALFQAHLGQSPGAYVLRQRLRWTHIALRQTDASITDIALRSGFSSSQHFATAFRKCFGVSPQQCRRLPGL